MYPEWEGKLNILLTEVHDLSTRLSEACEAFENSPVLLDADDREEAEDALDEAADCLTDAENCLAEALKILKKH